MSYQRKKQIDDLRAGACTHQHDDSQSISASIVRLCAVDLSVCTTLWSAY